MLRPHGKRVKTPTLLQMEAVECGAAALGIIQRYYGLYLPLEELRVACGVSRDGSKASNVLRAARRYGMEAHGMRLQPEELEQQTLPVIVFWRFKHFLVVEGFGRNRVYLNDPAFGPRHVSREEFDNDFTGVALVITPGSDFKKGGKPTSIIPSLAHRLRGSQAGFLMMFLSTLGLVVPGIAIPGFTRIFIDEYLTRNMTSWVVPILLAAAAAFALNAGFTWLQQHALLRLQTKLAASASAQFLWHALRLPVDFFAQRYAGDISLRLQANDRVARLVSGDFGTGLVNIITVTFYAVVMFVTDWVLALIGIGLSLTNAFAVMKISRRLVDGAMRLQQEEGKLMMTAMNGLLTIESIKATGQEDDFFARWAGYHARARNSHQELSLFNQTLSILPTLMSALSVALVLGVGGLRVVDGVLTIGTLIAFQILLGNFSGPIRQLVQSSDSVQKIHGDLARLDDVLRHDLDPRFKAGAASAAANERLAGFVALKNVTFGYSRLEPPFIENFSLSLEPGTRVALVGATGSGKTTIVKLLLGLYQPWSGEILFDGRPIEAYSAQTLERSIATVSQDIHLFDGTVKDNLTLWDSSIPEAQIVGAARDACIHDDIVARQGGYDSPLSEGGRNFSGGQRQRLEIARALARNPAVLILDEATAALDPVTEQLIDDAIRRRGCTCAIVAHRLSTIRDADEIIVMGAGKILERGTHEELRGKAGHYAELIGTE
jgi:NHLM bacteriocin system ABC transporter peptidase/ATP-binding protein